VQSFFTGLGHVFKVWASIQRRRGWLRYFWQKLAADYFSRIVSRFWIIARDLRRMFPGSIRRRIEYLLEDLDLTPEDADFEFDVGHPSA